MKLSGATVIYQSKLFVCVSVIKGLFQSAGSARSQYLTGFNGVGGEVESKVAIFRYASKWCIYRTLHLIGECILCITNVTFRVFINII